MTDPETSKQERARDLVRMVWLRNRTTTMERLAVVESALAALAAGELDAGGREEAKGEAHKLRGILGTYGFAEGSVLAGEAEDLLAGTAGEGVASDLATRLGAFALALPDS